MRYISLLLTLTLTPTMNKEQDSQHVRPSAAALLMMLCSQSAAVEQDKRSNLLQ